MLNTITFNTSCKPKLLHWRGTRATKCPTISLNKHANVCVGPPSNLPRVSALFSVVELACFFARSKPQPEAVRAAQVLRGGQVSTTDSAAVLSSCRATLKSKKVSAISSFFPLCCVVVMNEGTPHVQALHAHQNAVPCLPHQIIPHPAGGPGASVHLLEPDLLIKVEMELQTSCHGEAGEPTSPVIFNPAFISLYIKTTIRLHVCALAWAGVQENLPVIYTDVEFALFDSNYQNIETTANFPINHWDTLERFHVIPLLMTNAIMWYFLCGIYLVPAGAGWHPRREAFQQKLSLFSLRVKHFRI